MKKCLLAVFGQFGTITDVVLSKAYKLRGQAWVVFSSEEEAAEAKSLLQGFPLYEKPLVRAPAPLVLLPPRSRRPQLIEFAKTKSNAVAKEEGTFVPRPAYDKAQRKAQVKGAPQRNTRSQPEPDSPPRHAVEITKKRRAKEAAAAAAPPSIAAAPPPRLAPTIAPAPAPAFAAPMVRQAYGAAGPGVPHKILFVQGLPHTVAPSLLTSLFQQFPGFREVRMVEVRPGIAFVEYENEGLAAAALGGLQGSLVEDEAISITFANR